MWKASGSVMPTVLIVENNSGDVFIIENKESKPQVEKILSKNELKPPKLKSHYSKMPDPVTVK
jgi:hypothetical protein